MALTSVRGKIMKTYLPGLYEKSRVVDELLQVEGVELDKLRQALNETLDQFFVRTSTWGLDTWEQELGLSPAPDQPEGERRDRVVSRIRGTGTATIRIVKEVAESYDHGAIDVVEDFAAYAVTIQFVDTTGVPPNLTDLQAAVRAVVPAHLALEYQLNYLIWDELNTKAWTWDQLEGITPGGPAGAPLAWDELEVLS